MNKVLEGKDWNSVTFLDDKGKEAYCNESYFEKHRFLGDNELSAFNLGIYRTVEDEEEVLWATKYVGAVPILSRDDEKEKSDSYIIVSSRFAQLSPTKMLSKVLSGMDYYENPERIKVKNYSASEWYKLKNETGEKNVLFGTIDGIGEIDLSSAVGNGQDVNRSSLAGIVDTFGVFEIIDFVNLAKQVCKKTLKKQSNRVEENLNCKVKGRILVQKQIKYNEARGQTHRMYCAYNKLSENIKENQIMKYALYLCLNQSAIGESLREDIQYCMNCLSGVALKKCSSSDFIGIKNNGAFRQYKDVMEAAKKVINRYFVGDSNSGANDGNKEVSSKLQNFKIKPYFIDINLLFELYCRAIIREAIEKFNNEDEISKKKIRLSLESAKYDKRELFAEKKNNIIGYFMPTYIPDLVIKYEYDGKDYGVLAVLDAKNSDVKKQIDKRRERTHQVLFYMKALPCYYGGLMSQVPTKDTQSDNEFKNYAVLSSGEGELSYIPVRDVDSDCKDTDNEKYIISYLHHICENLEESVKAKNREEKLEKIHKEAKYSSNGFKKETSRELIDVLGWDDLVKENK